jgi:hypothetical protein
MNAEKCGPSRGIPDNNSRQSKLVNPTPLTSHFKAKERMKGSVSSKSLMGSSKSSERLEEVRECVYYLGSYGVVFKGIHMSDYDEAKGLEFFDSDDYEEDESTVTPRYAVKRIFPTINAPFILIEMLILKLVKGHPNVTDLIAAYRKESQVSLIFKY